VTSQTTISVNVTFDRTWR